MKSIQADVLPRIEEALRAAAEVLNSFANNVVNVQFKKGDDPVTEADTKADQVLRKLLLRDDEGWLSEETADTLERLNKRDVWVVDPLDGTREFVAGIPEWAVSVGFVRDGLPLAGGVCNPQTGEMFLGSTETGVFYNNRPAAVRDMTSLDGAVVLASRSEFKSGQWAKYGGGPFKVRAVGSVAYKLAPVAAGLADATWTLVPKHEWDVAAGVALVLSGGGARTLGFHLSSSNSVQE